MGVRDKIKETIDENKLLCGYCNVLLAFSGGPDSLCLLDVMINLKGYFNIDIYALHVNHMLRGEESDADEAFCLDFCESRKIKLFTKRINITELSERSGTSIEEAARNARYDYLRETAFKIPGCAIFVAHNRNDRAETVLFNIIRGTGAAGLRGMDYTNDNIIRPMLDISRSEIENYLADNELIARQDLSNKETVYNRNKIRLDLIPSVDYDFKVSFIDNLIRMSDVIKDDDNYLMNESERILDKISETLSGYFFLDRKELAKYHIAIQRRVIRDAIKKVRGSLVNIDFKHIERLLDFCSKSSTNSVFELPGRFYVTAVYNRIMFCNYKNELEPKEYVYKTDFPGIYNFEGIAIKSELLPIDSQDRKLIYSMTADSFIQYFDYDKIKGKDTVIRNRRENDYIIPLNFQGRKKLNKFFSDEKIPLHLRSQIKLLASGGEVIWIIGYRISDSYKIDCKTKTILKCEVEL